MLNSFQMHAVYTDTMVEPRFTKICDENVFQIRDRSGQTIASANDKTRIAENFAIPIQ